MEEIGVAAGRERRTIKPNMMDDHIYYVKQRTHQVDRPQLTKSQIEAKRQAKIAAKQFEKQKLKTDKTVVKPVEQLDFNNFSLSEDAQLQDNIAKMRLRIRD